MSAPKGVQGPTVERLALAERVRVLRDTRGLIWLQIATELGISRSYASELYGDPDGSRSRARKDSYAGSCVDCGDPTSGSNGHAVAPSRCAPCRDEYQRSAEYAAPGTYWTRERIIEAIRWWADEYGEPPAIVDWSPSHGAALFDLARTRRAERLIADRRIPWFTIVVRHFGSWNAGIVAAGFEPRARGGNQGSRARQRGLRRTALNASRARAPEVVQPTRGKAS